MRCRFCGKAREEARVGKASIKGYDPYVQLCGSCMLWCDLNPHVHQLHKIAYLYNVETPKWRYWYD